MIDYASVVTMSARDYYDAYWRDPLRAPSLYPELVRLLEARIAPTFRCIDVGCGDGKRCGEWLSAHAGSYCGVDVSEVAISRARSIGLDARLIDDAATLPFADGAFDAAVCIEVLEHLLDPAAVAGEILRVLRPGGTLVATVPNIAYWRRRLDLTVGRWDPMGDGLSISMPWRDPHLRFFTLRTFRSMLAGAGFTVLEMHGHLGKLVGDLPYLKRVVTVESSSPLYRALQRRLPSVLALRLHAVAARPGS